MTNLEEFCEFMRKNNLEIAKQWVKAIKAVRHWNGLKR